MLLRFIFILTLFGLILPSSYGFFEIAEVMPNTLDDTNLEYVTLKNNYQDTQSLSGYILQDVSGKQYTFGEADILQSGERIQYFRTLTKIILNNSDETIELYTSTGNLVDSISYEDTEKGVFLSFEDIDISPVNPVYSGEAYFSDEMNPGDIPPENVLGLPSVHIDFQIPSYVSQSGSTDIYLCDNLREECKINFNFEESFSSEFPQKNYSCEIDFGLENISGQEERCNPNTLIFPIGVTYMKIKIYETNIRENYIERSIEIHNQVLGESEGNPGNGGEISDSFPTDTLLVPKIFFDLQRPSYIYQKENQEDYFCDTSKEICKANFNLEGSFKDGYKIGDYVCEIDFGLGELTGEELKCNPNTVDFPVGNYEIRFKIYHKNNRELFSQHLISLENAGYNPNSKSVAVSGYQPFIPVHFIGIREILIQSGVLQESFNVFHCKKEKCSMNLNYIPQEKGESCLWTFEGGIASSETTHTRCNPGIIKYGIGEFRASLTVFEKGNDTNYKKIDFKVLNLQSKLYDEELYPEETETKNQNILVNASIELQGKILKEKTLGENSLICEGKEKCFVNFIGILQESQKGLSYMWTLNGEIFSEKLNPSGVWIESGIHTIEFQVWNQNKLLETKYFNIEVIPKEKSTKETTTIKSNKQNKTPIFIARDMSGIELGDILVNPAGADTGEFIQIRNTSLTSRNLEGCILADAAKKYIIGSEYIETGTSKYFFKGQTNLTLGNSKDSITLSCGETILSSIYYERKIADNQLLTGGLFPGFSLTQILGFTTAETREALMQPYLNLKFTILKRGGLKITGNTFKDTTLELYSNGKLLFTLRSDAQGKILLKTKNIAAGNYSYTLRVSDTISEYYAENIGKFEISSAQRNSWFYKKPSTKKVTIPSIPQFVLNTMIPSQEGGNIVELGLSLKQKILYSSFLLFLVLAMGLHILSLRFKTSLQKNSIILAQLSFSTRQKVLLLGV